MSKKSVFLLFLVFLSTITLMAETVADPVLETGFIQFTKDMDFFSTQFPILEGMESEDAAVTYIEERLSSLEVPFSKTDFDSVDQGHSFSRSLYVRFDNGGEDELILAVALDNRKSDSHAESVSINLALQLALIEYFRDEPVSFNVSLLFLGAEWGEQSYYPMGTKQFLDGYYPEGTAVVLYIDFDAIPQQVLVRCGDNGIVSPSWMIKRCSAAMESAGLGAVIQGNENQVFRLRSLDKPLITGPYLDQKFPSLLLQAEGRAKVCEKAFEDFFSGFVTFIDTFSHTSRAGFPEQWDRHYLFFQGEPTSLIIDETTYVIIVLALFSGIAGFYTISRRRIVRYRRVILRNSWALPVLLTIIFGFLFFATLFMEALSMIRNFPTLWRITPVHFVLAKLSVSFFLFFLLYWIVRKVPFPSEKSFYSASAVFLFFLNIVLVSIIDISLSYYFVWAFLCSFLFTLFSNRYLKLLALIAAPFWLIKALVDAFTLPSPVVLEYILFSRYSGNLLIAFILLPFILMIIRMEFFGRHHTGRRRRLFISILTGSCAAVTGGLFIFLFSFSPFSEENPQPVTIQEKIQPDLGQRLLTVQSPAPLTGVELISPYYQQITARQTREFTVESETIPDLVHITASESRFLNRRYLKMDIRSEGKPARVMISLHSEETIIIFASNFPYSLEPQTNRAILFVGENPPNPLHVEFTLSEDVPVEIKIDVQYSKLPHPVQLVGEDLSVDASLVVTKYLSFLNDNKTKNVRL